MISLPLIAWLADAATAMCTGGSHKWVDILFFTENHIDPHPSCRYESFALMII
jgi:hypothetical protein